jgi:hypothetical protein
VRVSRVKKASVESVPTVSADKTAITDCGWVLHESFDQQTEKVWIGDALVINESDERCSRPLNCRLAGRADTYVLPEVQEDRTDVRGE